MTTRYYAANYGSHIPSQFSADLREAVVYQGGLDGHVAADPVIHIGPVLPQGVSVVLYTAALDTKPGKYDLLKRRINLLGMTGKRRYHYPKLRA